VVNTVNCGPSKLGVALEADVVVCGGGPAGFAAAVAAAREGASVVLLEKQGCLGGLGTAGLLPCFNPFSDGDKPVVRGIGEEVLKALAAKMGVPLEYDWFTIDSEMLKLVYDEIGRASGAVLRLFTPVVDVVGKGRVEAVVLSTHDGPRAVAGGVFIDATGDGDISAWAGADFEVGDGSGATQGTTLCFTVAGVDWDKWHAYETPTGDRPDRYIWELQFAEGKTPLPEPRLAVGILPTGRVMGQSNSGHVFGVNGLEETDLTDGIIKGRANALRLLEWYRSNVPGFENVELAASAPMLGVRETRRIIGEYLLTIDDYNARASFEDEIGRNANPIDVHSSSPDVDAQRGACGLDMRTKYGPGESYGIPYRALIPRKLENVLVAGRCISTDRLMHGSTRVMPACFVTGQAAGAAAALAVRETNGAVRDVDTARLREALADKGAYLP
jgi:hypothetical protein